MALEHKRFGSNSHTDTESTEEKHRNVERQEVPNTLGKVVQIQLTPVQVNEARKEPGVSLGTVKDKMTNQTKRRQGKQSPWLAKLKAFCNEASVVGLRYVANPSASTLRRSIWVLLLLVGAGFTVFQIQDRIRYFFSRPVSINIRIEHADEIRFPTVTICNENRVMLYAAQYLGKVDVFIVHLSQICVSKFTAVVLRPTQLFIPPESVNDDQLRLGSQRHVRFMSFVDKCEMCR